jgi:ribosomal protein S18 acetylase RimI-like enzyme
MTSPPFHLRPAIASDLEAILTLERVTDLAPHWPLSAYSDILAAPMGSSGEGYESGAPSIPRSLRNGWETAAQRCLLVSEKNGSLIGFAVGLLHPAPHDPANLKQSDDCSSKEMNCHSDPDPDPERSEGEGEWEESPHLIASSRIAELESVVVSDSYRRTGIGGALCRAVFDWARSQGATELVLEVRAASSAAIALYAALGFTLAARRPRYYRDPADDALLMRLQLKREKGEQPNESTSESLSNCTAATMPVN